VSTNGDLVTVRRWTSETGKTGWRWQCHTCPPIRPASGGTGGRPRGGFHWDSRFVIARMPRHPGAWRACLQAAQIHVRLHHRKEPA
jgi:hypothetical protein